MQAKQLSVIVRGAIGRANLERFAVPARPLRAFNQPSATLQSACA